MEKENRSTSSASKLPTIGSCQTRDVEINETQQETPNAEEGMPKDEKLNSRTIRQTLSDFAVKCLHPWSGSSESSDRQRDRNENVLCEQSDYTSDVNQIPLPENMISQGRKIENERSWAESEEEIMLDQSPGSPSSHEELSCLEEFLLAISFHTSDNVPCFASQTIFEQKSLEQVEDPIISENECQQSLTSINSNNARMTTNLGGRMDCAVDNRATNEGFLRTSRSERVIPLLIQTEAAELPDEPGWVAVNDGDTIPQSQHGIEGSVESPVFAALGGHVPGASNAPPLRSESIDMKSRENLQMMRYNHSASAYIIPDTDTTGTAEPATAYLRVENDLEPKPNGGASFRHLGSKSDVAKYGLLAWKMEDETIGITPEKRRLSSVSVHLRLGLDGEVDQAILPQEMQDKNSSPEGSSAATALMYPATRASPFAGFVDQDSNGGNFLHSSSTVRLSKRSAYMNPTTANRRSLSESCCSGEDDDYMTKGTYDLRHLEGIARSLEAEAKLKSAQISLKALKRPETDDDELLILETAQPQRSGRPVLESREESPSAEDSAKRLLSPIASDEVSTTGPRESSIWKRTSLLESSEELKPITLTMIAAATDSIADFALAGSSKSTEYDPKALPEVAVPRARFELHHSDEPFRVYLSDLACEAPAEVRQCSENSRTEHIGFGNPQHTDTAKFEKTLDRKFRLQRLLIQENVDDEAPNSQNMVLPTEKCRENIDPRLSIASTIKRRLSWKVSISRDSRTSVENNGTITFPDPNFVSSEPMTPAAQANAIYNLVTDQCDLEILVSWATMPNVTTTTGEDDEYRVLRSLLETISGPRYWVFDVEELQCESCMDKLTEARSKHVVHSIEMTAKSIRSNHSHCTSCHYDISCTHETRIGELFRHLGADGANRIQYLRLRSHQDDCINPDHLASGIQSLKGRLPGLQSVQVDLHLPGQECCLTDKQRDKKLICSLQELETFLPPKARLIISQLDKHTDLEKRWRSVRRGWWIGTIRDS